MAETLSTLSIISFAVAGVSFVLAVFFWFFFKIPTVIGDLSGRTARKSIAKMRAANEKTGVKTYKESKANAARGKLTGNIPDSAKLNKKESRTNSDKPETGLLAANKAGSINSEETGMLDSEATGLLIDEEATAALDTSTPPAVKRIGGKALKLMEEVMLIHTDEVI